MKVVVAASNQEKALVGAFFVIVKTDCETDGSSAALVLIHYKDWVLWRQLGIETAYTLTECAGKYDN